MLSIFEFFYLFVFNIRKVFVIKNVKEKNIIIVDII